MMKPCLAGLCALLLMGCGVDGEPTPPPPKAKKETGIRVSGEARAGISITRNAHGLTGLHTGLAPAVSE